MICAQAPTGTEQNAAMYVVQSHWNRDDWLFDYPASRRNARAIGSSAMLLQHDLNVRGFPLEGLFLSRRGDVELATRTTF